MAMSLHPISLSSLLSSGGCAPVSPPLLPAPFPGLAYSLLLGLLGMGLGLPKSESGPGLGCRAQVSVLFPHRHIPWTRNTECFMHSFCCEALLASITIASGSASVLGLRSCTRLVWGIFVAPLSRTRLAMEVAAYLPSWRSGKLGGNAPAHMCPASIARKWMEATEWYHSSGLFANEQCRSKAISALRSPLPSALQIYLGVADYQVN